MVCEPIRSAVVLAALALLSGCSGEEKPSSAPADSPPPESTDDTGSLAPEPSPVSLDAAPRRTVLVQVLDDQGLPLEGASVSILGRSARVDASGNARISGITPWTEAAVVRISAPGHADLIRRLDPPASSTVRLRVALPPLADLGWFVASEPASLELEPFDIDLPAFAFATASGQVYEGTYHLSARTWAGHDDDADPDAALSTTAPAPLLAESGSEELSALETRGMLQIEVTDTDGAPLFLAEGQRATLRVDVTDDTDLPTACEDGAEWWWMLDEGKGLWAPAFDAPICGEDIDLTEADGARTLTAYVAHFTKFNIDFRRSRGCGIVTADLDEALLRGAEVEVEGAGYTTRLSAEDGELQLLAIPRSKATARLYLYDRLVDEGVLAPGLWSSDLGTCVADPLVLGASADVSAGGAEGPGLLARLRAGDCPAAGGGTLVVKSEAGVEVARVLATEPSVWVGDLDAGTWIVSLRDASDLVLDQISVEVVAGQEAPSLVELAAPADTAFTPPGGCLPLPCEGEQCSSCVQLTVTEDGLPAESIPVSWAGATDPLSTGADGTVCVDLPERADQRITAALPDGTQGTGTLPRGASCAADSCLDLALSAGTGLSCPTGTRPWTAQSIWLGPTDPGFLEEDQLIAPISVSGGALAVTAQTDGDFWEESDLLADAFGCDAQGENCVFSGEIWSWEALTQDADGSLSNAGLRLRAGRRDRDDGVSMDLNVGLDDLARGEPMEAASVLTVFKSWEDAYGLPFRAESGTLTYDGQESGAVVLTLHDVVLTCSDTLCAGATLTLQGRWVAPLLTVASFPAGVSWMAPRPLLGAWSRVVTQSAQPVYGPASALDDGAAISLCLPDTGSWMLVGAAEAGALRPFSPLQVWRKGAPALVGNKTEGGTLLAQPNAVWVDRQLIAAELLRQGKGPGDIDQQAAVIGLATRCEGGSCEVVTEGELLLSSPATACADQRVDLGADGRHGAFAFVGIDPDCATMSNPYVLTLKDSSGVEIASFRQSLVPVAGGAMVVLPEGQTLRYADRDGDGYGDSLAWSWGALESGQAGVGGDCDDTDIDVHPSAAEGIGDGVDANCDGEEICFVDSDGDAFASEDGASVGSGDTRCDGPGEAANSVPQTDCDDEDSTTYPGAPELCGDGAINDCNSDTATALASCSVEGTLDLADVATTFVGENTGDMAGFSVSGAGDVDGDGHADILIGALREDTGGTNAGAAYLLLNPVAGSLDLSAATAKLTGEADEDNIRPVSAAGDLDGDGMGDLFIGAPLSDTGGSDAGTAYLVLGPVTGVVGLGSADALFVGEGATESAGWSVSGAGDANGDGTDDLILSARGAYSGFLEPGAAYLVLGPSSGAMDLSEADAKYFGETHADVAGQSVSGAGDVDGDGQPDLLVGAYGEDSGGASAGAAYLVQGVVSGVTDLSTADAKFIGEAAGDWAGWSVSDAGDVDGDGYGDVIVGAFNEDTGGSDAGAAYLLRGPTSGLVDLSDADAKLIGESDDDGAGISVSGAGDVDGDGQDDLLIGAFQEDSGGTTNGAAYLVLGPVSGEMDLSAANAKLSGRSGDVGWSVSDAGDVDADGGGDLLVSAHTKNSGGIDTGVAYLVFGAAY